MAPALRTLAFCACVAIFVALPAPSAQGASTVRVAVASNFRYAMAALADRFESSTGDSVEAAFGSSGKHYAQIRNGAPFDAFFAADAERPQRLEDDGVAVRGTRFTYALGQLVLWSPRKGYVDAGGSVLRSGDFRHIAIANPDLAPYGAAAHEALVALGLWDALQDRLVRGENIAQAYQFVRSGNAELGFIAQSLLEFPGHSAGGSAMTVPPSLYSPIEQQAVLIRDTAAARAFLEYTRSPEGRALIRAYGYGTP